MAPWTPAPTELVEGMRRARGSQGKEQPAKSRSFQEKVGKDVQKRTEQSTEPNSTERGRENEDEQDWAF